MTERPRTYNLPADEREAVLDQLRAIYPRGSAVTTVYMRGNRTGDAHWIMVLAAPSHTRLGGSYVRRVSYLIAQAGIGRHDRDGQTVVMSGGGMDMAYDIVDRLSRALYGEGYLLEHNPL